MSAAISVRNVSKRFRLQHERYMSLKERMIHLGKKSYDDLWALDDVTFDIEQGTTFGLMGHNGSGKSTLLKLVGGILQPTSGEIVTKGRIAALLELGAGMQQDLTGRENIYLNGAILGLSQKELTKRFDEIVGFSELDKFIDTQVRFYSSGMYVRLGFAIAVNVDPDILLVDEVLAVGDELFQRKCYERVKQFQREGRTIVVVTHSVDQIRMLGDSAAVLDHGKLVFAGPPSDAIRNFREHLFGDAPDVTPIQAALSSDAETEITHDEKTLIAQGKDPSFAKNFKKIHITSAGFSNPDDPTSHSIHTGGPLQAQINWETTEQIDDVNFSFEVYDNQGNLVFEAFTRDQDSGVLEGSGSALFLWDSIPLADGTYTANAGITSRDGGTVYDWHEQEYTFEVTNDFKTLGTLHLPVHADISTGA
jgi:ABC-2 type transport system ATP-binding protein